MKRVTIALITVIAFLSIKTPIGYGQEFTEVNDLPFLEDIVYSKAVSMVDYNNDGNLDVFIGNGVSHSEHTKDYLYTGDGMGGFARIEDNPIVNADTYTNAPAWADYDNDGDLDLYVATNGKNTLFENENGVFGLLSDSKVSMDQVTSLGATWGDYNGDGYLDLYVVNGYRDLRNKLFRNNGDGSFTVVEDQVVTSEALYSWQANWVDVDNDGDLDLYVVNANGKDHSLYINKNGEFVEREEGIVVNDGSASGASWGDYDNDGDLDLFVAHGSLQDRLYQNQGDGTFNKVLNDPVVDDNTLTAGSCWADFNNDGFLDLYVASGQSGDPRANLLYMNDKDGTFTEVDSSAAVQSNDPSNSVAVACGDYNNDGFVDILVTNWGDDTNQLYRNEGNDNNWIVLDLKGTQSNYSAIGTKVWAKANINGEPTWQYRTVRTSTGHRSQNSLEVEFGLGKAEKVDSLIIEWPSGLNDIRTDVNPNQYLTIEEDTAVTSMALSMDKVGAIPGDTARIPVRLHLPNDSTVSAFEVSFSKNEDLEFAGIDTSGSIVASKDWIISANDEQQTLNVSGAGAAKIKRSGKLLNLQFVIPENGEMSYGIFFKEALINTATQPRLAQNGKIVFPAYGDVDYNQKVQAYDASLILKYLVGNHSFTEVQKYYADVSSDSSVSALDASLVLQYTTGEVDTLPVQNQNNSFVASGSVNIENVEEKEDETVQVPLNIENADNIYSFKGMLNYDQSKLVYQGISGSDFSVVNSRLVESEGKVYITGASTQPVFDSVRLLHVNFKVVDREFDQAPGLQLKRLQWNENSVQTDVASGKIFTDLDQSEEQIPSSVTLKQNYPNPFNPTTTIEYSLPEASYVTLRLYSVDGRLVKELESGQKQEGLHKVYVNGQGLSSGIYYYRLKTKNIQLTKKALLLK